MAILLTLLSWTPAGAQAPLPGWLLDVNAEGGHEDAVRFQSPDDPGDRYARVRGDLLRHWMGTRGTLDVVASGDARRYAVLSDLDRLNYGVAARATRKLTPRANGSFSMMARTLLATDISAMSPDSGASGPPTEFPPEQVALGARLPRVAANLLGSQAEFEYKLAPRTSATFAADYLHTSFDSPLLTATNTTRGSATLAHQVAPRNSALLQAEIQRGSTQRQPLGSDNVAAGWQQEVGPMTGRILGGATRSTTPGSSRVDPTGAAQLMLPVASGSAEVEYSRRVSQAVGVGTMLTSNRVAARYERNLIDAWEVTMSASHAWSRDPDPAIGRLGNTDGAVDLKHVFGGSFLVGGAVTYRRREQEQLPTLRGFDIRLYFGVVAAARS